MANVSFVAAYALQPGTTSVGMTDPGGGRIGDVHVLVVGLKNTSAGDATADNGFRLVGSADVGTGADGAGTGPIRICVFAREQDTTGSLGTTTISNGSANVIQGGGAIWRSDTPGSFWRLTPVFGSDTDGSSTAFSATVASILNANGGDMLHVASFLSANTTLPGRGLTTTGLTGTLTGIDSGGTANGNGIFIWTDRFAITGGKLSAASATTGTTGANTTGGTVHVLVEAVAAGADKPIQTYQVGGVANFDGGDPTVGLGYQPKLAQQEAYTGKKISLVGSRTVASPGDSFIADILEQMGHEVIRTADTDAVATGVDLHFITESGSPGNLGTKYLNLSVPVVSLEVGGWDDQNWASGNGTTPGSISTFLTTSSTSPIIAPYGSGATVTVKSSNGGTYGIDSTTLSTGAGIDVWATHTTTTTSWHGFSYEVGALLLGGAPAAARQVGWGLVDSQVTALNPTGQQVLRDIVTWAMATPSGLSLSLPTASETDVAPAFTTEFTRFLPTAAELDVATALTVTEDRTLPTATETDVATSLVATEARTLPTAVETDNATALTATEDRTLPTAAETDVATALTATEARTLPTASEVDAVPTFTITTGFVLPTATETDVATNLTASEARTLPGASETDVATALTATEARTLPTATETDVATSLSATEARTLPTATETDVATGLTASEARTLPTAAELDVALGVTTTEFKPLPTAAETDTAATLTASELRSLPTATELDVATQFNVTRVMPTAAELDVAGVMTPIFGEKVDITVTVGPPRIGSAIVAGVRVGSVSTGSPRMGSLEVDETRMGSVKIGATKIERGP